jgi:crotonobetaine/carnitine-CoA ligase
MDRVPALEPIEVLRLYPPHGGTLSGLLRGRAAVAGGREFLLTRERSLGLSAFEAEALRAAAALAASGIRRGERVGVMSANCAEIVVLLLATARLGAILVPVNPEFSVGEARYVIEHCGAAMLFASAQAMPAAREAAGNTSARLVCLEDFQAWLDSARANAVHDAGRPDDTCVLVYTSGTTGFPKGVMHSQRAWVLTGEAFVERMRLQPDERLLCVLPLFHINALFYSLGGALAAGATLILEPRFSASTFWHRAAETRATQVNILAAAGNILARRPLEEFVPHSIRKVYGAPIGAALDRTFKEDFGVPVVIEGYGMSEIPGACNNRVGDANRIGSMGLAALHPDHSMKFSELKIIDDAGRDLPDGEAGELAVRTPIVMQGYYRDPEQTRLAFRDGWFLTGDLVRRAADGYVWFVARKKDIIRRRGENVSGAELDRVIGEHPAVLEAAAIAVPAELGEDDILVAVVARPGAELTVEDVAAWCRARLSPYKQPRYVALVESLPHTPSHRVAKYRLKGDMALLRLAVEI